MPWIQAICAATDGPDKPGHDDEGTPSSSGKYLILLNLRPFPGYVHPVGLHPAMTEREMTLLRQISYPDTHGVEPGHVGYFRYCS